MRAKLKEVYVNLNDKVLFSPTSYGQEALNSIDTTKYRITEDGLVEMRLWIFIREFCGKLSLTNPCPLENMDLIIR